MGADFRVGGLTVEPLPPAGATAPGDARIALQAREGGRVLWRTRVRAYRWNGFGFAGLDRAELRGRCAGIWGGPRVPASGP